MWFTPVKASQHARSYTYDDAIMSIGSCFADEMGKRLSALRFDAMTNPLGIVYNPVSLKKNVEAICNPRSWSSESIFVHEGKWRHDDFHSKVSASDKAAYIALMHERLEACNAHLSRSSMLILTLGTSFGWRKKTTGKIVGNCHKLPSNQFDRELLTSETMLQAMRAISTSLKTIQPTIDIVVTVSPIRHLRDGLVHSQWSKSRLIDVCQTWASEQANVSYFPAYEIMMDELRDYRFYASDKIHPSDEAVDFIFERFFNQYFYEVDAHRLQLIKKINKLQAHRPSNQAAQTSIENKIKALEQMLIKS